MVLKLEVEYCSTFTAYLIIFQMNDRVFLLFANVPQIKLKVATTKQSKRKTYIIKIKIHRNIDIIQSLYSHFFTVHCILPSKSIFELQLMTKRAIFGSM